MTGAGPGSRRRASPTSSRPTTRKPTSRDSSPRRSTALPAIAETFEIIAVNDGSRDRTQALADELTAAHPGIVRAVHHPTNLGYGAALRSGFAAARYELVAFTDGDRQFRVEDLGRLTERLAAADQPDVVVGYRIRRADPLVRTLYARAYRLANRIFFGLTVTDVDCACKLFRREALEDIHVESDGAFFSAELLIKLRAAGRSVVEVGVPHYPRTAGLTDGRETAGHRTGGPRFLADAPGDVGEPGARSAARPADHRGRLTLRRPSQERRAISSGGLRRSRGRRRAN